jgi:hypothetical protein
MSEGWTVNENDLAIAKSGIELQAQAYGVDLDVKEFRLFVDHMINVVANLYAQIRWVQNIIHKEIIDGIKVNE